MLIYSIATAACGFAQSIWQLAVFRIILGFGMGGEWASGAALVSETWPDRHRGKALGLMQSAWAIGYAAAAIVTWLVHAAGRLARGVFRRRILPALLTVWVRRRVEEPAIWQASRRAEAAAQAHARDAAIAAGNAPSTLDTVSNAIGSALVRIASVFTGPKWRVTLALTLMNSCTLFAWWGFNLWIPAYLSLPVARGGIGLTTAAMSGFVVAMQVGMWFGYVTFGYVADAIGRRRTYVIYLDRGRGADVHVWPGATAGGAARARPVRRLLRDRPFQRPRRRNGGDLRHRDPRHGARSHLQRRPHRQRARTTGRRQLRREPRLRRGAIDRLVGLSAGRVPVYLDSRNQGPHAHRVDLAPCPRARFGAGAGAGERRC